MLSDRVEAQWSVLAADSVVAWCCSASDADVGCDLGLCSWMVSDLVQVIVVVGRSFLVGGFWW